VIRGVFRSILAFSLFLGLFAARDSLAWSWYFEFGANLGKAKTPSPLLLSAPRSELTSPLFIHVTLGLQLQDTGNFPQFQLGVQNRYFSGSGVSTTTGANESFTTMATYPVVRIEIWRFLFGVGYTPWVWKSIDFKKNSAEATLYEASFLFPITPEIDFGLNYAQQSFKTDAGTGPKTTEYGLFFRLNYGLDSEQKERRRKFKGWRYPFGLFKK
jgi:hypothetical protein